MILGIDASNIRSGGGITHLVELLRAAEPAEQGFSQVIVWSGQAMLQLIEERPWLVKSRQPLLDKSLPYRTFWQRFCLSKAARTARCDVLFVPGGSYAGDFRPMVTFNQNLLPFEWRELKRFGWSWIALKSVLLRMTQGRTFRRADGLIFLTQYAKDAVMRVIKNTTGKTAVIPHGVDKKFVCPPREQLGMGRYSRERPFRILYVSSVFAYKHQWHVADAVAQLRLSGLPVTLDLVGPAQNSALKRLRKMLSKVDPSSHFVRYSGVVPYVELPGRYAQAELCVFASSCEAFGQVLTEAMLAGLPIACSNRSAMPEILGETGIYFDPEDSQDIARALKSLVDSPELRTMKAKGSFDRANVYSWQRCAGETFGFLAHVAKNDKTKMNKHENPDR